MKTKRIFFETEKTTMMKISYIELFSQIRFVRLSNFENSRMINENAIHHIDENQKMFYAWQGEPRQRQNS